LIASIGCNSTTHKQSNNIYKNVANVVSILGVLPLCLLFQEGGIQYLIPLIVYNNVMDDLDGILAARLNIRSRFGAALDNVCDSISHSILMMFVGIHFGGLCIAASLIGVTAIVWRGVARLDPEQSTGTGSPTNELVRHVFFVLVLAEIFGFGAEPYLIVVFLLHTVSMHVPYKLHYLIRSMTKSHLAISLVNVALILTWLVPNTAPVIATCFMISYLYSLVAAFLQRDQIRPV
jgi:phosphatidylglycerophosphate synthase